MTENNIAPYIYMSHGYHLDSTKQLHAKYNKRVYILTSTFKLIKILAQQYSNTIY